MAEDFDGFYTANFGDTVAMAYTLTADVGEAQDIAQEAFSRAWRQWTDICGYDNPVAWVRRVAANLARSRWRRAKLAASTLVGMRLEEVPPLNPDHVAVVAALRKLPARQREAVVLHHILDLPVSELAEHFDVPVGTVKSWLHRGRAALADDLRIDVRAAIVTPPADSVKKRRKRASVAAISAAIMLAAGVVAVLQFGRSPTPPVPPLQSPTPSPSPSPADPMYSVNWTNAEVELPPTLVRCSTGGLKFKITTSGGIVSEGGVATWMSVNLNRIAIGDLNGDGHAEAVIGLFCLPHFEPYPQDQLAVFERHADGTLAIVAVSTTKRGITEKVWISSGVIGSYSRLRPNDKYELGRVQSWRLAANSVDEEIGPSAYPSARSLDLSPLATQLPCGSARPESDLRLWFAGEDLLARAGGREFGVLRPGEKPIFKDRQLVLTIGCRPAGANGWHASVVAFDMRGGDDYWRAVRIEPG